MNTNTTVAAWWRDYAARKKQRQAKPSPCPNCTSNEWRVFMSDISQLSASVHKLIDSVKLLTNKATGDKATIDALTAEIKSLKDEAAAEQAAEDALAAEAEAAATAAAAASDAGASMGGNN
jgi:uncharacterized phage infection (PIP) family protein YhgE